ncbi:hypothetical protein PFISCL1PPCAC_28509 [Pristionchus fissidentatus]|uniref:Cytoplasmic dynein 2 light intermediate chain 1 n=1 Tax=Pristionchus fissidentatus TaxID=1538716 RepID=A0AAV5WLN6_9BILA|nr:hypothetical protein PFISCL1PPCAC_24184 [Pristionchus fissidentatus]GMT37212.1 hypothetical protein PFISCL1PPCAC_28509 [Pristionchus fissidentatus]
MEVDLWDLAKTKIAEKEEAKRKGENEIGEGEERSPWKDERTLIICGGKSCGKTSTVLRFLDKNESARPTTALEYLYARRMRGNSKQLCHVWELGGGTRLSNLLKIPITMSTVSSLSLIVVVDLTKPQELKNTVEGLLPFAKREIDRALKELNSERPREYDELKRELKTRLENNKEQEACMPFPIPLAFIGNKYDGFQNREPDERRKICKMMRFLSHYYGATLVFYSSKLETTLAKGRLLFAHHAFGAHLGRSIQTDINKPLFIPVGLDSYADIGPPPMNDSSYSSLRSTQPIDLWWGVFAESFATSVRYRKSIIQ